MFVPYVQGVKASPVPTVAWWPSSLSQRLGIVLMVEALLVLLAYIGYTIAQIVLYSNQQSSTSYLGTVLEDDPPERSQSYFAYTAFVYAITGIFGLAAGNRRASWMVGTFLALCAFSVLLAAIPAIIAGVIYLDVDARIMFLGDENATNGFYLGLWRSILILDMIILGLQAAALVTAAIGLSMAASLPGGCLSKAPYVVPSASTIEDLDNLNYLPYGAPVGAMIPPEPVLYQ